VEPSSRTDDTTRLQSFCTYLADCQRPIFLYAMSLLHRVADAEEVLQQTNLVLWQKFQEFDPRLDFVKWACGIARYEALRVREKQPLERRLFSDPFFRSLAAKSELSCDALDGRRNALEGCLKKLSEDDQSLVLGRYQPGATVTSMAQSLGRSPQAIRKSLRRIRAALMACILRTLAKQGLGERV
jgi:RNA polymerase sigma-70 factor (ECF subfamily)